MTYEKLKSLQPGTRLVGVGNYGGEDPDEQGTFIGIDTDIVRAIVEWDNCNSDRHSCNGRVRMNHGWWVPTKLLELAEQVDFGEFTPNLAPGSITELLGG